MKTFNILRLLCVAVLLYFATTVSAKQFYVSAGGNDANDGSTQALALKTIGAAVTAANAGDEILIVGTINVSAPITVFANVKFTGVKAGDGNNAVIDGKSTSALFNINGTTDGKVIFSNLDFQNGVGTGDGPVQVAAGTAHFSNCGFYGNIGNGGDGGAVSVTGAGTTGEFYNCTFEDNISTLRGGALGTSGGSILDVQYSQFDGNSTAAGSAENRGGAISLIGCASARFFRTNVFGNYTGGQNTTSDSNSAGGGAFVINGTCAFYMEASSVTGNVGTGDHGGAFFIINAPVMTFVNTTISGNVNQSGAGAFFCASDAGFTLTFVNVTMTNNVAPNNNGGNGAGLRIMNATDHVNIFNSILVGNYATNPDGTNNGICDITFNSGSDDFTTIKNSVIGFMNNNTVGAGGFTVVDNANITNKSLVNEYTYSGQDATGLGSWTDNDKSGLYTAASLLLSSPNRMGYYSLTSGAYAASLGDPALLNSLDVASDQFLATRPTAGAIWAGSVQGPIEDAEVNDPVVPDDPALVSTGLTKVVNDDVTVGPVPVSSSSVLTVNFGSLSGQVKGELVSVSGQVVKILFNQSAVGKGFYAMDGVAPGFYILKITQGNNLITKQLIVK